MQSATDEFEFSDNFSEEALPDRFDFDSVPVDPQNPGFASFLAALQGSAEGHYPPQVLEAYLAGLTPRLEEARAQLRDLVIPEAVREQVAPAVAATQACLDEMSVVLDLVDHHLAQSSTEALYEAIERLQRIHGELKHAL